LETFLFDVIKKLVLEGISSENPFAGIGFMVREKIISAKKLGLGRFLMNM
jgi:hypothetical protein